MKPCHPFSLKESCFRYCFGYLFNEDLNFIRCLLSKNCNKFWNPAILSVWNRVALDIYGMKSYILLDAYGGRVEINFETLSSFQLERETPLVIKHHHNNGLYCKTFFPQFSSSGVSGSWVWTRNTEGEGSLLMISS